MSGTPTEAEIQAQWRAAVDILENTRAFADGTLAGASGLYDVLQQSLEGEYTPTGLSGAAARHRELIAASLSQSTAADFLTPILAEYSRVIGTTGVPYTNTAALVRSLWEHLRATSATVRSRNITFDTAATLGGSNVGNGSVSRLTVDEGNFALEACHVEVKKLRCREDARSGAQQFAELFEFVTQPSSHDSLLRASYGSGEAVNRFIRATHAGSGRGGSLLRNSSFSTYSASASPKFSGWTETAGGTLISQHTANYYRTYPGATVDASLKIDQTAPATVTLTQPLTAMSQTRMDPNRPYLLRAMVNKTVGTASGGNFVLKLGSQTLTTTIGSIGANWQEVVMPIGANSWFRNFNTTDLSVVIEWNSATSGYLLVDDVILTPFDEFDGTFWNIRHNTSSAVVPWKVDDTLEFTDTGGAAGTGKLQWWMWVAGLGYLPSAVSPGHTITEP